MAPRAYWNGVLKLSPLTRPTAPYLASIAGGKVGFSLNQHQVSTALLDAMKQSVDRKNLAKAAKGTKQSKARGRKREAA